MSLKFSFESSQSASHDHGDDAAGHGAPGIPLPFAGAPSGSTSSVLEMAVALHGDEISCAGMSGDGVAYARTTRSVADPTPSGLAAAVRSAIARTGAALPEPLIESVTAIVLELGGREVEVVEALGLAPSSDPAQLALVDAALQARCGVSIGTPIRAA